jgi:mono/diheme cytochrome c family protein
MKVRTALAVTMVFLGAGCSGDHPSGQNQPAGNGLRGATDSSAVAAIAHTEKTLPYEERQGKYLYEQYCAVCHGLEGKGDGFNAFNLEPRPRDFTDSAYVNALGNKQIVQTISGGGRSVNKSPLMPSYGWTLKKEDIGYVASYLATFASRK